MGKIDNFLGAIFIIGPVEEAAKFLALLSSYPFIKKELNEPTDGLIYMTCVALGFSLIENYFYATRTADSGYLLFARLFISTPAHILFSVFMGIAFYILMRLKTGIRFFLLSYFYASFVHGLYNAIIFHKWLIIFLIVLIGLSWRLALSLLSYTTAKSPFRKNLKQFIQDYEKSQSREGLECLSCGSKNNKATFQANGIVIQKCDQCPSYLTTKDSLFRIFHFFGSIFSNLMPHYRHGQFYNKRYSTLYKGNWISEKKRIAYFYLDELNEVLDELNQSIIDNIESKWWFPERLKLLHDYKEETGAKALWISTFSMLLILGFILVIMSSESKSSLLVIGVPFFMLFYSIVYFSKYFR